MLLAVLGPFVTCFFLALTRAVDVTEALGLPLQVASLLLVHHLVVLELLHGLLLLLLLVLVLVLVVADLLGVHFRTVTDTELFD